MTATYHIGDVFDVMAGLDDNSVDLILTSPPFLALRSYLPADHPDKDKEIGSEPTPAEFLDTLLALTAEWGRLLSPTGSLCVELGDTYSGSGGGGGDYLPGGMKDGQQIFAHAEGCDMGDDCSCGDGLAKASNAAHWRAKNRQRDAWPLDKSLCIIPELYAACLAYGRNVLTGEPSPAGQWRVRNLVRWVRPNPPVGALGDKFRPATSTMVVACRARDRWFDLDAVREPYKPANARTAKGVEQIDRTGKSADRDGNWASLPERNNDGAGAPPLDWWNISTHPYPGSHYATWPPRLCEKPIRAMCPAEVCDRCGEPRRRVVGDAEYVTANGDTHDGDTEWRTGRGGDIAGMGSTAPTSLTRTAPTLGWTVCDCPDPTYRPGIVLDPFAGSGTTLAVATGHGREAIGIDIDERNADLARERVGPMFFDTIDHRTERPQP